MFWRNLPECLNYLHWVYLSAVHIFKKGYSIWALILGKLVFPLGEIVIVFLLAKTYGDPCSTRPTPVLLRPPMRGSSGGSSHPPRSHAPPTVGQV